MMKLTAYNLHAAIDTLQAHAFLLLMSEEVESLDGEHAAPLWEMVGHWTESDAKEAIVNFDTTQ